MLSTTVHTMHTLIGSYSGHIFMRHAGRLFNILKNFVAVKSAPNVEEQDEKERG